MQDKMTPRNTKKLKLPVAFIVFCFAAAMAISFALGRVVWHFGLHHVLLLKASPLTPTFHISTLQTYWTTTSSDSLGLISNFGAGFAIHQDETTSSDPQAFCPSTPVNNTPEPPTGHHLFVDIKNVNKMFLNSDEQLTLAVSSLVKQNPGAELTLMSWKCNRGLGDMSSVGCVGILSGGYLVLHAWPRDGVVTLDLFVSRAGKLMSLVPDIENLFAIPQQEHSIPARLSWAIRKRGFTTVSDNNEDAEHENFLLGWKEYGLKKHVATVTTPFQTLEVYDAINSRFDTIDETIEVYEKSINKNNDSNSDDFYEAQFPELFQPDRFVYLDKVMQSRRSSLEAYHDALVHPAMMTHANPRRVAIIGGGDGAALREVLKHKTVESCVMIEIDEMMVNASKTYLPQWNDCSRIAGSTDRCFDDPRAEMYYEDAVAWFVNRFSDKDNILDEDKFDVIIIDALGPSSLTELSDEIYKNHKFLKSLYNALTRDGVLVAQVGPAETPAAPAWTHNVKEKVVYNMVQLLQDVGFKSTKRYSEMNGGFGMSWSFLVALRRYESQELWYANPAEIDLELSRRTAAGQGDDLFQFFDGATMQTYQYPSRIDENVHCRAAATANGPSHNVDIDNFCSNGHGLDPFRPNADASSFNITTSLIPNAGRGLLSVRHLTKGSYIAADAGGQAIYAMPSTYDLVQQMLSLQTTTKLLHWTALNVYLFGYGVGTDFYGTPAYIVETSKLIFINHGCNGTGLMGGDDHNGGNYALTELTADPHKIPDEIDTDGVEAAFYNPFAERNHWLYIGAFDTLQRDMTVGAELLDNYLRYLTADNWQVGLADYKAQCLQQHAGWITKYEINNTV